MVDAPPPDYLQHAIDILAYIAEGASVLGLLFSIQAYRAAGAAKREAFAAKNAAEDAAAAAREAGERASVLARKRNLVEELDDVHHRLQLMGSFLHQQEWTGVQIRIDEVIATCRQAKERWPDHLSKKTLNGINTALTQFQTIATVLVEMEDRDASVTEMKNISNAYRTALGHVSDALGEARRREERDGTGNAN
jgi:hypothetical protein